MGKDLHYTIILFIERALSGHNAVAKFEMIDDDDYYIYKISRRRNLSNLIIVLSDAYNFNHYSYLEKPEILKEGGIILVARPEASCFERNETDDKIVVGKLGRVLGALHHEEFWTYEPPKQVED